MKRPVYMALSILLLCVFLFSAYMIYSYVREERESSGLTNSLINRAVIPSSDSESEPTPQEHPPIIENQSVREIALTLSLSESAVQQRLRRGRLILKEGMDMAREFGKRSYKPENIEFSASGSISGSLPWSAVQRKIPKNILLQANNNPSTPEEPSIELGIALPYMEDEVEALCRAMLLQKILPISSYWTETAVWKSIMR